MKDLILLLPEIYILMTALGIVIGEVGYHGEKTRIIHLTSLMGLLGALLQVLINYNFGATQFLDGILINDGFCLFFKVIFIVAAMVTIYASKHSQEVYIENRGEFSALVLGITGFLTLSVSSANLLLTLILLQGSMVLGYLLIAQQKRSQLAVEASVKKMAASSVSFLFLGFGALLLFSTTSSMNIYEIHRVILEGTLPLKTLTVAFTLILAGVGTQMCIFPSHFWAADIYQGAATPTAGFLSLVFRASGVAVLIRLLVIMFAKNSETRGLWISSTEFDWTWMVAVIAALTLLVGGLLAYRQTNVRRLLSCLVVTQTGFLLLGVIALDEVGFSSLLYNLAGELFAVLGVYAALSYFVDRIGSDEMDQLGGVLSRAVPETIALMIYLASLVGLPPLPGFIGKFILISAAIRHGWNVLAMIAIFSAFLCVVSATRFMFKLMSDFRGTAEILTVDMGHRVLVLSLLFPLFLMTIFSEWILNLAGRSVQLIFW